jgi:ribonuclease HII
VLARDGRGVIGVDEAGKGPVLGPMVAAAVRADPAALPADVDDSKRVAPDRRAEMAAGLREDPAVEVGVAVVPVDRIDDPATDMNTLTVAAQAEAVASVAREGDAVVADAGDVSESRFARRLREGVADAGVAVDVAAEHGADEAHAVVGAASVVAKVDRDRRVAALDEEYAAFGPVGSGYPGDATTRTFLGRYVAENGDLPPCARRSWATSEDVLAAAEQAALDEF